MQQLPVGQNERAAILDALRGFALLGIIIMNTAVLSGYIFLSPDARSALFTAPADRAFDFMIVTLFMGKFYSVFSLLFGIGFSIFLSRKAAHGVRIFYRRMLVLMLIGLTHAFLVWDGDILFLYAVLGCALPLFRHMSNRTLLIIALSLILSPVLIDALKLYFEADPGRPLFRQAQLLDKKFGINSEIHLFTTAAGYDDVLKWNTSGFFYRWADLLSSNRLVKVLGLFLIGYYIGRNQLYLKLEENRTRLRKIFIWSASIGLPASLVMTWIFLYQNGQPLMLGTTAYALSVVPLAMAYTAGFCLLWLNNNLRKHLQAMAPAGRMALTNYMMQSVICILVYYNLGLALGTRIGAALFFPLAVCIWGIQVYFSKIWFRYYQFGPLEWVWRCMVYGKKFPMKRTGHMINEPAELKTSIS